MKYFVNIKRRMALLLILSIFSIVLTPDIIKAQEPVDCERALKRCLADSLVAGVLGGPYAGVAHTAHCIGGYAFCKEFLET